MDHETEMQKALDGLRAIAGPPVETPPANVIAQRNAPPVVAAPAIVQPAPTPFKRPAPAAYTRPIPASPQPVQSPAPAQMQSPALNPIAYKQYLSSIGGGH